MMINHPAAHQASATTYIVNPIYRSAIEALNGTRRLLNCSQNSVNLNYVVLNQGTAVVS